MGGGEDPLVIVKSTESKYPRTITEEQVILGRKNYLRALGRKNYLRASMTTEGLRFYGLSTPKPASNTGNPKDRLGLRCVEQGGDSLY